MTTSPTPSQCDEYCLQWNDFEANAKSTFNTLRHNSAMSDVFLIVSDPKNGNSTVGVPAHKVILSSSSPMLSCMFSNRPTLLNDSTTGDSLTTSKLNALKSINKQTTLNTNQLGQSMVFLPGVSLENLNCLLDFVYCGQVNVSQENLNSFLSMAEDLKISGLTRSGDANKSEMDDDLEDEFEAENELDISTRNLLDSVGKKSVMNISTTSETIVNNNNNKHPSVLNNVMNVIDEKMIGGNEAIKKKIASGEVDLTKLISPPVKKIRPSMSIFPSPTGSLNLSGENNNSSSPIKISNVKSNLNAEFNNVDVENIDHQAMESNNVAQIDARELSMLWPELMAANNSIDGGGIILQQSDSTTGDTLVNNITSPYKNNTLEARSKARTDLDYLVKSYVQPLETGYLCQLCKITIVHRSSLLRHMRDKHLNNGIAYKCPMCQRKLTSLNTFMNHVYRQHPELKGLDLKDFSIDANTEMAMNEMSPNSSSTGPPTLMPVINAELACSISNKTAEANSPAIVQ